MCCIVWQVVLHDTETSFARCNYVTAFFFLKHSVVRVSKAMKTKLFQTRYTHWIQCLKRQGKCSAGEKSLKTMGCAHHLEKNSADTADPISFSPTCCVRLQTLCWRLLWAVALSVELPTNIACTCQAPLDQHDYGCDKCSSILCFYSSY